MKSDPKTRRLSRSLGDEGIDVQPPPLAAAPQGKPIRLKTETGPSEKNSRDEFQRVAEETLKETEKILRTFKQEMATADPVFIEEHRVRIEELEERYFDLRDRIAQAGQDLSAPQEREQFQKDLEIFRQDVLKLAEDKPSSKPIIGERGVI
jgi:hypothetical protein